MAKFLLLLLGVGALCAAAYWFVLAPKMREEKSRPKQQLENVQKAADRIEDDWQKRADEMQKKGE